MHKVNDFNKFGVSQFDFLVKVQSFELCIYIVPEKGVSLVIVVISCARYDSLSHLFILSSLNLIRISVLE